MIAALAENLTAIAVAAIAAGTSILVTVLQHRRTRNSNSTEHGEVLSALLDLTGEVGGISERFDAHVERYHSDDTRKDSAA